MSSKRQPIYLAADHGGWQMKRWAQTVLEKAGWRVIDVGPDELEPDDDYPVLAAQAARLVRRTRGARGILFCRSGVGMAIVANKFKGIRAVQGWNPNVARRSRQDEDTNVLTIASDEQSWSDVRRIMSTWLETAYRPIKRYERRLKEIRQAEHGR